MKREVQKGDITDEPSCEERRNGKHSGAGKVMCCLEGRLD
jgi:hypothetical protein